MLCVQRPRCPITHTYRGVPERMAQVVPEARLIYVVRDPIARMQSMYVHQVSAGPCRLAWAKTQAR